MTEAPCRTDTFHHRTQTRSALLIPSGLIVPLFSFLLPLLSLLLLLLLTTSEFAIAIMNPVSPEFVRFHFLVLYQGVVRSALRLDDLVQPLTMYADRDPPPRCIRCRMYHHLNQDLSGYRRCRTMCPYKTLTHYCFH